MGFPEIIGNIRTQIFRLRNRGVSVERAPDPETTARYEAHGKTMLVRLYTDPESLESLGAFGNNFSGFLRAGEELKRMEAEWGINSNAVPHLTGNLGLMIAASGGIIAACREQALSLVAPDRKSIIEGEALLESQRLLVEKLREEGLTANYRAGASKMLETIQNHLRTDIALTGENSV